MKSITLVLGVHNHQPVGNFDFVFEDAYQKAYLPFFSLLERHAHIKLAMHFSGILFQWIEEHHPDFIHRLTKMVMKGRIELLSGGYYEPILPSIPPDDQRGQIKKLSKYIARKTGAHAQGLWLAERVWEPTLPALLQQCGIRYTIIDDSHFKYAGVQQDNLYGYHVTEHLGAALNIFPISERLRYLIPFSPPEDTIDYLRSLATEDGSRIIVFADDGEKFGSWPHTFEQCYQNHWIEKFFSLLQQNREWIRLMTFQEVLEKYDSSGRIYLPTASYREMMEWALPSAAFESLEQLKSWLLENNAPPDFQNFIRGGFWRQFLAKYPESNSMHKRMLMISQRLAAAKQNKKTAVARDHLYAGQCNCPYWHGVFGGLYLPHLRHAIYKNLIEADKQLDAVERKRSEQKKGWVKSKQIDFDADGFKEVIVDSDRLTLFWAPRNGGSLFEFDYKAKAVNLADCLSRRQEGYHRRLLHQSTVNSMPSGKKGAIPDIHAPSTVKESGLQYDLRFDHYRHALFLDHFLPQNASLETFLAKHIEVGDFMTSRYEVDEKLDKKLRLTFTRAGHVHSTQKSTAVEICKQFVIRPKSDTLKVKYQVKNIDEHPSALRLGVELPFNLLAGDASDRYFIINGQKAAPPKLAGIGCVKDVESVVLMDEWQGIAIRVDFSPCAVLWRFPIETISMSEAGFEKVYQASILLPNWQFRLEAKKTWSADITIKVSQF